MSRNTYTGPRLPKNILEQVHGGRISNSHRTAQPRSSQRRVTRQDKKTWPTKQSHVRKPAEKFAPGIVDTDGPKSGSDSDQETKESITETKSLEKRPTSPFNDESNEKFAPVVSKAVSARIQDDDAEIAALEKKLGIKRKKASNAVDDGLDWLVGDLDSDSDEGRRSHKRKRSDDDEWLEEKRLRARDKSQRQESRVGSLIDDDSEDLENPPTADESSEDEFEGFGSDESQVPQASVVKKRENPYVAPVSQEAPSTRYVPPSLRKPPSSDGEALKQLRRQLQGLLNRLSEANILSILQSTEQVYSQNARQYVTSTLVDMLTGLVSDPAVLNDSFLVLHAGFTAALHKVIGTDFAAQLLESLVQLFDRFAGKEAPEGKQLLNLVAFVANLYSLQVVGSEIMFDYIRLLLTTISETNTELLLRIIRISGAQLRHDDPTSLKDIVLLLQRSVAKVGESELSIRTKFMIETIQDLKNNRTKTGASAAALAMEQMQRMKKTLGSLNNRAKASEPLRITLADIRDTERKGKWWLVGASYKDPAKMATNKKGSNRHSEKQEDSGDESETSNAMDLDRLARAQGMNTGVRRAVFVSIAGAVDYKHAHMRLMKLNLKNKQLIEIPRVLVHCVGAEAAYNHYYTIIAREFCGDHKLRKAYQFALLDVFRRMGEQNSGDSEDEPDEEDMPVRKIYNLAKMYGTLIADGLLRVSILKTLDLANLRPNTQIFVEVLLVTVMARIREKGRSQFEGSVKSVFQAAHAVPDLVTGLRFYLSTILTNTEIASSKKEKGIVIKGCEYANEALLEAPTAAFVPDDESSGDEDLF